MRWERRAREVNCQGTLWLRVSNTTKRTFDFILQVQWKQRSFDRRLKGQIYIFWVWMGETQVVAKWMTESLKWRAAVQVQREEEGQKYLKGKACRKNIGSWVTMGARDKAEERVEFSSLYNWVDSSTLHWYWNRRCWWPLEGEHKRLADLLS